MSEVEIETGKISDSNVTPKMAETHYFISDIHFCHTRLSHIDAFNKLCQLPKAGDKVILLGDIFEAWTGDDVTGEIELQVEALLLELSQRNVEVYFMHGNRDFLVGKAFCQRTGCRLLKDPCVWTLPSGRQCVLTHGDRFCTHDKKYKRFRTVTRNKIIQWIFLRLPKGKRISIADSLRQASKESQSTKSMMLLDAHEPLVNRLFARFKSIDLIIMGHTHRPKIHKKDSGNRVVLGDWGENIWYGMSSKDVLFNLYEADINLTESTLHDQLS